MVHVSRTEVAVGAGEEVARAEQLSCGEHTDYGMLTMVNQDDGIAALQVCTRHFAVPRFVLCWIVCMHAFSCNQHRVVHSDRQCHMCASVVQVKNAEGKWITAEPIPGTFVCNIGDMMSV